MADADWLDVLRAECAKASLRKVADKLRGGNGYPSTTLLSQVLSGTYSGQTDRLERLVKGYFMGDSVRCPVLGAITRDACDHHQHAKFLASNAHRIALYRACRAGCANSHVED